MTKSELKNLPRFGSLDELVKFFDTHDLGEYWTEMPEAHFEVDVNRKTHLFAINTELANKLTDIAKSRKISSEVLISTWLKEKIQEQIENGELASKEQVREGSINAAMKFRGKTRAKAEKMADEMMQKLPRWRE